jgi:hypothetical protein
MWGCLSGIPAATTGCHLQPDGLAPDSRRLKSLSFEERSVGVLCGLLHHTRCAYVERGVAGLSSAGSRFGASSVVPAANGCVWLGALFHPASPRSVQVSPGVVASRNSCSTNSRRGVRRVMGDIYLVVCFCLGPLGVLVFGVCRLWRSGVRVPLPLPAPFACLGLPLPAPFACLWSSVAQLHACEARDANGALSERREGERSPSGDSCIANIQG